MNFYPNGRELLVAARDTFIRRILPSLPHEVQKDGLMVANALGIVARELEADIPHDEQAHRALVEQIRAGAYDDDKQMSALTEHLIRKLTEVVKVDNPHALREGNTEH